jgi:predicted HD phosphohydrolase
VRREAVEDLLQIVDRRQVNAEQIAVLACDSVTLADLGCLSGDLGDPLQLARRRADADDRGHREAERCRVELRVVAPDRARALQPLHALGDRWRRQADPASELGESEAPVLAKFSENS